ncbi:MAG: hypothetical protein J5904_02495, partial [Anaerovibrio sp.]|nr:hypothetical protein [Anaerovibrio sp.]
MMFFIMTAIIMTVAILVVYKVARALDWALSLPALVGCGVCALLINFLSIPVAPFLTEYRFTVLGAMVLVAAIVITSINHFFIRKRRKQLEATDGENSQLKQEAVPAKDELVPVVNSAILSDEEVEALIAKDKEPEPEPIVQAEPKVEEVIPEPEPMIEVVVEEVAPEETVAEAEAEIEPEDASEPEEEIPEPEPIIEAEPVPSVDEKLADTSTLDDVLDYAFELKGSSDWSSALKAYNYALEQYRDDAYAPF